MSGSDAIAVRHLALAESRHSDIGRLSFEQGTVPIEKRVAEFLRKVMKRGALRTTDPKIIDTLLIFITHTLTFVRKVLNLLVALASTLSLRISSSVRSAEAATRNWLLRVERTHSMTAADAIGSWQPTPVIWAVKPLAAELLFTEHVYT